MNEIAVEKIQWVKPGVGISASGRIPEHSEIFQDHFPDFPVLPGVLALEMLKQTAERYLNQVEKCSDRLYLKKIHGAKFHTYLKPGDAWESRLELVSSENGESHWNAKLFHGEKLAVSAQLVLAGAGAASKQTATQGG